MNNQDKSLNVSISLSVIATAVSIVFTLVVVVVLSTAEKSTKSDWMFVAIVYGILANLFAFLNSFLLIRLLNKNDQLKNN